MSVDPVNAGKVAIVFMKGDTPAQRNLIISGVGKKAFGEIKEES